MRKLTITFILIFTFILGCKKTAQSSNATNNKPYLKIGITRNLNGEWFPTSIKDSLEKVLQHRLKFVYFDGISNLLDSEDSLDLAIGVDKSFLRQAIVSKKFSKYKSDSLNKIRGNIKFNKSLYFAPIFYDFVCILIDTTQIKKIPLTLGKFQEDFYNDQLVFTDPKDFAYSRMFYVKTLARFTQNGHRQFWSSIKNKVRAIVSSPAFGLRMIKAQEAAFLIGGVSYCVDYPRLQPILLSDLSIKDVFGVGIYKNSGKKEVAKKFIDLLLSDKIQDMLTNQLAVYPVVKGVITNPKLPAENFVDESKDAIKSSYIDWRSKRYLDKHHDLFENL